MVHYNVSFAGAGKVADSLCRELYRNGYNIEVVVSETRKNGPSLASSCEASWSDKLKFPSSANLIIVAVPDHKLMDVLDKIECSQDTLVVHTAGSIGLDLFPATIKRMGVLYPLQTFSKGRDINYENLPFFIETVDSDSSSVLEGLVKSLRGKVYTIDADHRRLIHLSAVFVCNFTNHMLTAGKDIIYKAGLPFEVLNPLITETILKAIDTGPEKSQTGPAVRHDKNTIKKHLELLSFSPDLQRLYEEITLAITNYYKSE